MQTSDVGSVTNPFTVSGNFIRMADTGNLMAVSALIQKRDGIAADLQQVERKLLACNHPQALANLARSCQKRKKDFGTELTKLAEKLETKKRELTAALQQIDERLAQENFSFEWTLTPEFASLIPTAASQPEPAVALRFMIIDRHLGKTNLEICRILDSYWRDGEHPPGFLPYSWTRDYRVTTFVGAYCHRECRNRVHKMISVRRQSVP
jgi:hypothetical protein